ncbi:hypothetical protein [Tritonibacter scottomollicae]|uniref:hypothetical protein n=1 Tax=Tritonibacter scottomollicae TaxID=483013 RepID=UPI003AA8EEC4
MVDTSGRAAAVIGCAEGKSVLRMQVARDSASQGAAFAEGDGNTPEGRFRFDRRNPGSASPLLRSHHNLQARDQAHTATARRDPHGEMFIHGKPKALLELVSLLAI